MGSWGWKPACDGPGEERSQGAWATFWWCFTVKRSRARELSLRGGIGVKEGYITFILRWDSTACFFAEGSKWSRREGDFDGTGNRSNMLKNKILVWAGERGWHRQSQRSRPGCWPAGACVRHLEVGGCSHPPDDPYFTDGKIKVQGGDLPKASLISSKDSVQVSWFQVLECRHCTKISVVIFYFSEIEVDLYRISWTWSPKPGVLVPTLSLGSRSCSTSPSQVTWFLGWKLTAASQVYMK